MKPVNALLNASGNSATPAAAAAQPVICAFCRAASESGARFCPQCGRSLVAAGPAMEPPAPTMAPAPKAAQEAKPADEPVAPPPVNAPVPVPKQFVASCPCGRDLPDDAQFCPACGRPSERGATESVLQIVCQDPSGKRSCVSLGTGELVIGKSPECGLVVEGDSYVSRRHARLVRNDSGIYLEDLGSTNGTFVRICRMVEVEDGDEILIGTTMLKVAKGASPSA